MEQFDFEYLSKTALLSYETQIQHMLARAFGAPGYETDILNDLNDQSDPVIVLCLKSDPEHQIAGFGYGYIAAPNTMPAFLKADRANIPARIMAADQDGTIGILKTIVTDKSYRGLGIGTNLVQSIEKKLLEQHAAEIIVPAWKAGNRINIGKIMNRTGYRPCITTKGFWKEECDAGNFHCTDRKDHCICDAVFYLKYTDNQTTP